MSTTPSHAELVAVVADVHGETAALAAVLEEADAEGISRIWSLGDAVDWLLPRRAAARGDTTALRLLLDRAEVVLAGNHEAAMLADAAGRQCILAEQEGEALLSHLSDLPAKQTIDLGFVTVELVHGSPSDPWWGPIETEADVEEAFRQSSAALIIGGHTHHSLLARPDSAGVRIGAPAHDGREIRLGGARWVLNPGSVGHAPSGLAEWGVLRVDDDGEPAAFSWHATRWPQPTRLFR